LLSAERERILRALEETNWNISGAARYGAHQSAQTHSRAGADSRQV